MRPGALPLCWFRCGVGVGPSWGFSWLLGLRSRLGLAPLAAAKEKVGMIYLGGYG